MFDILKAALHAEGITRIGILNIKECDVINERIMPSNAKSVVMFCIPYSSACDKATDGISEYARIYDYHRYCSELFGRIIPFMNHETSHEFYGFCDHSPINEKLAAAKCGLGVIGKNSLFIDDVFGSFVFLGTIISNISSDDHRATAIKNCIGCNKCVDACPTNAITERGILRETCLSHISQKKRKNEVERELLKSHNIVWGCDICQFVCPYNENATISPIPYFSNTRSANIDITFIDNLNEEEFNKYAFSYRGRAVIKENIEYMRKNKIND